MRRWLLGLALALAAAGAMAQTIVELDYVRQAVARGALLWDARDEGAFAEGHIPGAVNIGDPTLTLRDTLTEDYLPTADIEKALGAAGIDPAREIIVYGDRGLPSVYFAHLTLRYFGASNARIFHDGIDGWRAAGLAVSTKPVKPKPATVKLAPQPGVIVTTREVVAALKRPDAQLLDVRTVKEFKAEDIRAIRGGHIPGATNIPFEQNWIDPDARTKLRRGLVKDSSGMSLKPRGELARLYEKLDPAREVIVYCQSGNRAAQTRRRARRARLQERPRVRLVLAGLRELAVGAGGGRGLDQFRRAADGGQGPGEPLRRTRAADRRQTAAVAAAGCRCRPGRQRRLDELLLRRRGLRRRSRLHRKRHGFGECRLDLVADLDQFELVGVAHLQVDGALDTAQADGLLGLVDPDDVGDDRHLPAHRRPRLLTGFGDDRAFALDPFADAAACPSSVRG